MWRLIPTWKSKDIDNITSQTDRPGRRAGVVSSLASYDAVTELLHHVRHYTCFIKNREKALESVRYSMRSN